MLYLAFEHFNEAETYNYALECLLLINELVANHKADCMKAMKEKLKGKIKDIPYYQKDLRK